jgi:hypothetical protein
MTAEKSNFLECFASSICNFFFFEFKEKAFMPVGGSTKACLENTKFNLSTKTLENFLLSSLRIYDGVEEKIVMNETSLHGRMWRRWNPLMGQV